MSSNQTQIQNSTESKTRRAFPRLIVAQSLEQVQKLAKIQGGPVPQEYIPYAKEHGLTLTNIGRGVLENKAAAEKDIQFHLSGEEVVLYHIRTDEDRERDDTLIHQGQFAGKVMYLPWAEKTNFIATQMWYINDNGLATNLRSRTATCDAWGGMIDLTEYLVDVELLTTDAPTALTGKTYSGKSVAVALAKPMFTKRLADGEIRGTLGGPRKSGPSFTQDDFLTVRERDVAFRLVNVRQEGNSVLGVIKFEGPYAEALRKLSYPEDYVFGMRAMTYTAITADGPIQQIDKILTWDAVPPPSKE